MASVVGFVILEKCRWNASEFFHRPRRWTRLSSTELAIAFRAPVGPSDRAEIPCCWPECFSICDNNCAVEADTNPLYGCLSVMNMGWLSTVFSHAAAVLFMYCHYVVTGHSSASVTC